MIFNETTMRYKIKHIDAIKFLAIFKYLTSSMFVMLGLYKNRGDVTNKLLELTTGKRPLVKAIEFNFGSKSGRQESFYCLTDYGKKFLIEEFGYTDEQIKLPSRGSDDFENDYPHRKSTINFHIELHKYIENNDGEIDFFNYYFDKAGNNRVADKSKHIRDLNRLYLKSGKHFTPDVITQFILKDEEYLFVFEQHNGKDTKKLMNQIHNHTLALIEKTASKKYNFPKITRVAIVFEHESIKHSTIKRLQKIESFKHFNNLFIFKTVEEQHEDFFNNWTLVNGEKVGFTKKSSVKV